MDHQAFAQILGNYGEFLGAIAVVVTLFYLATQIRGSSKATESQVHVNLSSEMEQLAIAMSTDEALADAMLVAQMDGELTPKQDLKLFYWFGGMLRVCESHLIQRRLEATSVDLETPIRNMLRDLAGSSVLRRQMQDAVANQTATREFLSWLDSEVLAETTE